VVDDDVTRATQLPVDSTNSGEATGVGRDRIRVYASEIRNLALAGVRFGNIEAVVVDLAKIGGRLGVPLHGILGYSFLKGRIVRIDYPVNTVHVLETRNSTTSTRDNSASTIRLPLEFVPNDIIPLIPKFNINDQTIPVSLDTGSSLTVELFPAAVERLALQKVRNRAKSGSVMGARGRAEIRTAKVASIGIPGLILYDQEVAFSDRKETNSGRLGNLGNGYLKHFILTLDYRNKIILIEKPKA
jgi:predicted aspartyl protease